MRLRKGQQIFDDNFVCFIKYMLKRKRMTFKRVYISHFVVSASAFM